MTAAASRASPLERTVRGLRAEAEVDNTTVLVLAGALGTGLTKRFNPRQRRDWTGRWARSGGDGGQRGKSRAAPGQQRVDQIGPPPPGPWKRQGGRAPLAGASDRQLAASAEALDELYLNLLDPENPTGALDRDDERDLIQPSMARRLIGEGLAERDIDGQLKITTLGRSFMDSPPAGVRARVRSVTPPPARSSSAPVPAGSIVRSSLRTLAAVAAGTTVAATATALQERQRRERAKEVRQWLVADREWREENSKRPGQVGARPTPPSRLPDPRWVGTARSGRRRTGIYQGPEGFFSAGRDDIIET